MGCGGRASGDCTRPVRGCLGEETGWSGEEQAWKKRCAPLVYVCDRADAVSAAAGAVGRASLASARGVRQLLAASSLPGTTA